MTCFLQKLYSYLFAIKSIKKVIDSLIIVHYNHAHEGISIAY